MWEAELGCAGHYLGNAQEIKFTVNSIESFEEATVRCKKSEGKEIEMAGGFNAC